MIPPIFQSYYKKADTALYRAKQEGRHAYRFFAEKMNAHSIAKLRQETRLREGLTLGELEIHYQPQVSLPDQKLIGLEALLRWRHPTDGLLLPEQFLSTAEEGGLLLEIGAFVLSNACQQMQTWISSKLALPQLSVNIFRTDYAWQFSSAYFRNFTVHRLARRTTGA